MNGEEDEAVKIVHELKERVETQEPTSPVSANEESKGAEDSTGSGEIIDAEDDDDAENDGSAGDTVEVKPRRGRSSRKKV